MRNYPNWEIHFPFRPEMSISALVKRGDLFKSWAKNLSTQEYVLRIEPKVKPKTPDQMAWYRGKVLLECLSMINSGLPMEERITKRELDGFFSKEFLTVNRGTEHEGVLSKGDLSAKEFSQFIEHIILHMAENHGYVVEPPDKQWKQKRKTK
jgi:hypothetical protein